MLYLISAPIHRLALRIAYVLRRRFRTMVKPDIAGIAVILRDGEDRILLARHTYGPSGWALVGGGLGKGEDPADAARREIREELDGELHELACIAEHQEVINDCPHTAYVFTATLVTEPVVDGREIAEVRWFSSTELRTVSLTNITRRRLEQTGYYSSES